MLYVLTITNLQSNIDDQPFLNICTDTRWIYAISRNYPLLQNFKMKIESFTPERYLQYIRIEIIQFDSLSENERDNNSLSRFRYTLDKFYIEGVVNNISDRQDRLSYTFNDFTPDKWSCNWV
jgi:vacuolar-type H+-ATPase subunit C/Vma6